MAVELAGTPWVNTLRASLVSEFCRREAENRVQLGGLVALISAATASEDLSGRTNWLLEQTNQLGAGNELEAITAALNVMALAYKGKAHLVPGLVDGLLPRLAGSAPMSYAAAWALG